MIELTSTQNPRVKDAVRLKERRQRDQRGLFLIEGVREIERAVAGGVELVELFFVGHPPDIECGTLYSCSQSVMDKLSYREHPSDIVAVARVPEHEFPEGDFFLVMESIEKPGNLGAMLRTADAAGVDGVIVCDPTCDLYNPNVIRSSTGTLFSQPLFQASNEEALARLKGVTIIAATPSAKRLYTEVELKRPLAIVVGSEAEGLSDFWLEACDVQVRIPMHGSADSLNVSTAASLLLYEAVRQCPKDL